MCCGHCTHCRCGARRSVALRPAANAWDAFDAALFDDLDGLDGFDAYDAYDALDAASDDDDAFLRILRVLPTGRMLPNGATGLRVAGAIGPGAARQQLNNTSAGVFLQGATQQQARQWAQQLAQRMGGQAVYDAPHRPGGRPHFHIESPQGRTGHIFYGGQAPTGDFFAQL